MMKSVLGFVIRRAQGQSRLLASQGHLNNARYNSSSCNAFVQRPQATNLASSLRSARQFSVDVIKRFSSDDVTDGTEQRRTENELKILEVLRSKFPEAEHLDVKEGGQSCGDYFEVFVVTKEFKGMNRVKQHQTVIQHIRSIVKDAHVIRVTSQASVE